MSPLCEERSSVGVAQQLWVGASGKDKPRGLRRRKSPRHGALAVPWALPSH